MTTVVQSMQSATDGVMRNWSAQEKAIVEALDEPAIVVEGSLVSVANGAARQLFGDGVEGKDVRLAIRHPHALEQILQGKSADVSAMGLLERGRSWRLVVRDLGDGAVLVRMIDHSEAVSAEKMRVDFVANASHELRTPLSTVIGYAETLADDENLTAGQRTGFGRTIRDEARRMLDIIEDLMSLSRIEADRFVAPRERVALVDVIQTALGNVQALGGKIGCTFDVQISGDLPLVRGDRAQLVQLFDNLIGNAVRYGCDRTGAVIEIRAERNASSVRLQVTDQGPGIAREHLPRLTERFYRVDAARSRETGGTGLGLAIVKHIVERHRGSLEIASNVGVGTTVSVNLPMA